jgi:hypothetical protein
LLKTFRGWRDEQLPDGTVIFTLPGGETYVTTPGSALLFPNLCRPAASVPATTGTDDRCGERTAMMPLRTTTRAETQARRIAAERRRNRERREAPVSIYFGPARAAPDEDDEPPPF